MVRDGLNRAAVVTVRERGARQVLEDIDLQREIVVTADPALLLEPEPLPQDALKREGLDKARTLVGMSVREPGAAAPDISEQAYHKLLADAADFMVDRYDADVVFVPMEPKMLDVQHAMRSWRRCCARQRAMVLKGDYTSGQLLSLMQALRLRGRHAPALPDLREPAERAVRGPALRAQGRGLPRRSQDRDAAARCRSAPAG